MLIDNSTTFLHRFFLGGDKYSADVIDRKVDAFVVQFCIQQKMIDVVYENGKRMYHLLPEGEKVIKNR